MFIFDNDELKNIMVYISDDTKKCEFTCDFYINRTQTDKFSSVNYIGNRE